MHSLNLPFWTSLQFRDSLVRHGLLVAMFGLLMLMASPSFAAPSGGGLPDISIDRGQASTFISGIKTWWNLIANMMLFGGLGGAVFGYFFGGGAMWIRWGLTIASMSAFGEPILRWFMKLGGVDVLSSTS